MENRNENLKMACNIIEKNIEGHCLSGDIDVKRSLNGEIDRLCFHPIYGDESLDGRFISSFTINKINAIACSLDLEYYVSETIDGRMAMIIY